MSDVVTVDEVVSKARAETGLDDLGDPAWREGLDVLLDSAEREAALNDIGRMILRTWIHERLVNRLRLTGWVAEHPEVRDEQIERPIVVVGMLRTGSTLLCELLACDPANRALMKWEGLNAIPPPETATFTTDPRIAAEVEKQEAIYSMVPRLKAVHWEPGDGPTECVALLTQSFRAQDWHGLFRIPSYIEWFHGCDMQPAYDYHRLSLQVLQSRAPGRWSLKAPGHLLALDALLGTYPDARVVVLHRDPVRTVASSASLSVTSRPDSLSSADFDGYYGRMWVDVLGTMVDRLVEHRDRHGDDRFFDLHYRELVADPVAAVGRIYAHFDETLSPAAEASMQAHLAAHPKGRHGAHTYTLAAFGLDETAVRERFAAYCERFGVEAEA
ncbi:MAG: sulfotransferase family protein [Acidimicrobiia bacterium]